MAGGGAAQGVGDPNGDVYEVFAQPDHDRHHVHQFSLRAPSAQMALALARELFLRRENWVSVWVVPRTAITASGRAHGAVPVRLLDRSYREVSGYRYLAARWRRYMQEAMELKHLV